MKMYILIDPQVHKKEKLCLTEQMYMLLPWF